MKITLLLGLLPFIGCQVNAANCIATQSACDTGQMCDPVTERCVAVTPINPVPPTTQLSLLTVTPAVANQNAETTVTITGTGFQGPMTVQVGLRQATNVVVKSATELTAVVPQSPERCGAATVRITNADATTASRTGAFYFKAPQTLSFRPPASPTAQGPAGIIELLVDNVTTDTRNDIIARTTNSVSLCLIGLAGGFTCSTPIAYTPSSPAFMRTHDFDRNNKVDLLIIPRMKVGNNTGTLINNLALNTTGLTPISYTFKSDISINDVVVVDRLMSNTSDLWAATSAGIVSLPFGSPSTLDPTPLSSEVLQSMILARPETLTVGPELVGVVSNGGARVLDRDLMQTLFMPTKWTSTVPFTKLRLGDVSGDGVDDLVGIASNGTELVLHVALGGWQRSFALPTAIAGLTFRITDSFELADLTCDGAPGIVVTTSTGELRYLQRHQDSFDSQALTIPGNPAMGTFVVKDVNGDGRPDFVYTVKGTGSTLAVAVNGT